MFRIIGVFERAVWLYSSVQKSCVPNSGKVAFRSRFWLHFLVVAFGRRCRRVPFFRLPLLDVRRARRLPLLTRWSRLRPHKACARQRCSQRNRRSENRHSVRHSRNPSRLYLDPSEFASAGLSAFFAGGATSFNVEGRWASSSTAPSGVRIRRIRPTSALFLGGITSTTIVSPTLSEVLCQLASVVDGGLPSSTQCCTLPLSSVTSSFIRLCGLAKIQVATVPFIVRVFS